MPSLKKNDLDIKLLTWKDIPKIQSYKMQMLDLNDMISFPQKEKN